MSEETSVNFSTAKKFLTNNGEIRAGKEAIEKFQQAINSQATQEAAKIKEIVLAERRKTVNPEDIQ